MATLGRASFLDNHISTQCCTSIFIREERDIMRIYAIWNLDVKDILEYSHPSHPHLMFNLGFDGCLPRPQARSRTKTAKLLGAASIFHGPSLNRSCVFPTRAARRNASQSWRRSKGRGPSIAVAGGWPQARFSISRRHQIGFRQIARFCHLHQWDIGWWSHRQRH